MKSHLSMLAASVGILLTAPVSVAFADGPSETRAFYEESHAKYEALLANGSAPEKLLAIAWMGTFRKHRFVRPLSEALLQGLGDPAMRKIPAFDPYVKSQIAISLGAIRRREGLTALTKSLEITKGILESEQQAYEAKLQKVQAEKSYEIVLPADRAGPAMMKDAYVFPLSADGFWSIGQQFKTTGYDPSDEGMRVRMEGYNYVNLTQHLLVAIGEIQDPATLDVVLPFMEHPYRDVRLAAVIAAASIGGEKALSSMLARYEKETDDQVKARLCFGILHLDTTHGNIYRDLVGKYMRSDNVRVRLDAASALRQLALGESLFQLHDAFLLETHPIVKNVLLQAIHNANLDNILPPNRVLDTGPTRIWIHGEPLQPSEQL